MSLLILKNDQTDVSSARYAASARPRPSLDGWLATELLLGCLLFVFAKALAAEHNVYLLDRFDIWIVGLIPMVVLGAYAGLVSSSVARIAAARIYIMTWLLSLAVFLVLQDFFVFERLENFLFRAFSVSTRDPMDAVLCLGYSLFGVLTGALVIGSRTRRLYFSSFGTAAAVVLLNWVMLFVLVFWSRFAA